MFKQFEKAIFRIPLFPLNALFNKNNETYDLDFLAKEFLENEIFWRLSFWSSPAFYKILLDYSEGKNIR